MKIRNYNLDWSEYFQLDVDSPSGLVRIKSYRGKEIKRVAVGTRKHKKNGGALTWALGFKQETYLVHRIIWVLTYGSISDELVIDHLDGNPFNNKINNLELKTHEHNRRNACQYSTNKTSVTGVRLVNHRYGSYYEANWYEIDGSQRAKCFSISKYGEVEAKLLATNYREREMSRLIKTGAGYTDRHGT